MYRPRLSLLLTSTRGQAVAVSLVAKRLSQLIVSLALFPASTIAVAENLSALEGKRGYDAAQVFRLDSLCAQHARGHTFIMVGTVGCLQGLVGPEKVNFDGLDQLDTLVVRSSGGFLEQLEPLIRQLSDKDFSLVVPQFCLSACAMYLLPLADQAIIAPDALVAAHGPVFGSEEKYTEYFLTSKTTRQWLREWDASHPSAPDYQLKFYLRRMYFSYYAIKTRVALAFAASGADPLILDAFEGLYECAGGNEAAKSSYEEYVELDISFYAKYRDTSLWVWPKDQQLQSSTDLLGLRMSDCTPVL